MCLCVCVTGIHMGAVFTGLRLKITHLRLQPHLPGARELKNIFVVTWHVVGDKTCVVQKLYLTLYDIYSDFVNPLRPSDAYMRR